MTELEHFGVKGMRWGSHKTPANANYTQSQRDDDAAIYGRRGVKRINNSLNDGKTHEQAVKSETRRYVAKRVVALGVLAIAKFALSTVLTNSTTFTVKRDAGRLALENLPLAAKNPDRNGVYNLRS